MSNEPKSFNVKFINPSAFETAQQEFANAREETEREQDKLTRHVVDGEVRGGPDYEGNGTIRNFMRQMGRY